ncbi:MAG: TrmH family RNA methyltransferase [Acidimicrobiia bacterium]
MEPLGLTNPRIQRLRRLLGRRSARSEEGAFVVEGRGLLAEAFAAGWDVEVQFVAPGGSPIDAPGVPVAHLAPGVLERVASTESPQPVLGIVRQRTAALQALVGTATFVVVCAGVSDPGNLGTILRSAEAAGADAVVLTTASVDPFNPKVVRASAGALFHVPVVVGVPPTALRDTGWELLGTSSHQGVPYTEPVLTGPLALVVGSEAHGIGEDVPIDTWLTIPHLGRSESLNVAMAATVLCFEVARQRRG